MLIHLAAKVQEGMVYVSLVLYLNDGNVGWREDEVGELGGVRRDQEMKLTEPSSLHNPRGLRRENELLVGHLADGQNHLLQIHEPPQAPALRSKKDGDLGIPR